MFIWIIKKMKGKSMKKMISNKKNAVIDNYNEHSLNYDDTKKIAQSFLNPTHPIDYPAFTLAEVLITLGIIGIVSAMTIPTLQSNIQNRQFKTGAKKTEATLNQALLMMKANDDLMGYRTTKDFLAKFQKYMKVSKLCENPNLKGCFADEIKSDNEILNLSEMTNSASLGHENWDSDVEGFTAVNGTNFLVAYNPSCHSDDYKNCAAFAYDMNGIDNKNVFAGENGESDLGVYNAAFTSASCGNNVVMTLLIANIYKIQMDGPSGATDKCISENIDKLKTYCETTKNNQGDLGRFDDGDDGLANGMPYCEYPCLAKGTMITLADGSQKKVENITFDDELMVWDFDNGKISSSKAIWIMQPKVAHQYNLLTFSDGSQLKTIEQHRIFNKELGKFTYPMTDETPIGTTTLLSNGEEVQLTDKKIITQPVEYYNLITANHFNCFASNILTSNRFNNLYPISDYKFIKDNRELTPYSEYEKIVSYDWYEKLRLSEQVCDENLKLYLAKLVNTNQRELSMV